MAPSGIREEYLFPNDSVSVLQSAHSAISKKKKQQQLNLVHSVRVTSRCE